MIGAGTISPYAAALFDAFSEQPSSELAGLINRAFIGMGTAGITPKLDLLYVPAVHDNDDAKLNWITPGTSSLTENGSIVWTAGVGYTGNGSDAYATTGVGPGSVASQNNHAFGAWVLTDQNESAPVWGTNDTVGTACAAFVRPRSTGNFQAVSAATTAGTDTQASAIGFSAVSRQAAGTFRMFRNAGAAVSKSVTTTAWPDTTWDILRRGGSGDNYSTATVGMVFRSSGLTDGEMAAMYTIWAAYFAAINTFTFA